ncbi:PrsW family intramembrane metalloprotease [Actinomyces minihominis]|uniref:PrsW family intramembrane metalloprotease n=1 Tax=Actinomyces minihominis TaxID=2002838 RepID=UPI0013ED407C|nr:PrsW family intramembrane metalloprotease [Actinomyces minihominis]
MTSSESQPWQRYRLSAQQSEREGEGHLLDPSSPFQEHSSEAAGPPKRPARWWDRLRLSRSETVIVVVAIIGIISSTLVLFGSTGTRNTGVFGLIALLPLALVSWLLLSSDRIAPLPRRYFLLAVLWGAGVATATAAMINTALYSDFILYLGDVAEAETLASVLVAPFSEEILKGVGVVLILILCRPYVVSVANGVAVGGLAGAGFAFTENILYFANAQAEGSTSLGMTIFARAVMSPFVHPLATSFIGLGVAAAILGPPGGWSRTWRVTLGWVAAVLAHAMWNGLASLGTTWIIFYLLIEMPLFVGWLVWVTRRPRKQMALLPLGLAPYVSTSWISAQEVHMVSNAVARRHARKWGRRTGRTASKALRIYMIAAGRLGLEQLQMERFGANRARAQVAQDSLSQIIAARDIFLEQGNLVALGERLPR